MKVVAHSPSRLISIEVAVGVVNRSSLSIMKDTYIAMPGEMAIRTAIRFVEMTHR